jgi:hypothetical protein
VWGLGSHPIRLEKLIIAELISLALHLALRELVLVLTQP